MAKIGLGGKMAIGGKVKSKAQIKKEQAPLVNTLKKAIKPKPKKNLYDYKDPVKKLEKMKSPPPKLKNTTNYTGSAKKKATKKSA